MAPKAPLPCQACGHDVHAGRCFVVIRNGTCACKWRENKRP